LRMLPDGGDHLAAVLVGNALLHEGRDVVVVAFPGALEGLDRIARATRRLAEAQNVNPFCYGSSP
ncbi:MAG TPA: hypothetical protein VGJ84_21255, partial [Polyangiaceae bacterium]